MKAILQKKKIPEHRGKTKVGPVHDKTGAQTKKQADCQYKKKRLIVHKQCVSGYISYSLRKSVS